MAIVVNGSAGLDAATVVTTTSTSTLTNKTLTSPTISNPTFSGQASGLEIAFGQSIVFEGTTADAYELTLSAGDPTADRTITLPNATDTLVGKATTDTLTNKSLDLASNTLTGTTAQFNTALSDGDFATLAGAETLSNKTLTAPKFEDLGFIADANGNELIILDTVTSAVNEVTLANAATGNAPTITASGGDTNVSLNIVPKGSGTVQIGGVNAVTTSSSDTLTNKTLTAPIINLALNAQTGTTYTFVLSDNGKLVTASNASAQTYTIPLNSSVAYATGAQINIIQIGAGQVTIQGTGGVTVASTGATATAPKLRAQYSSATCIKVATDTWYVIGDIA